ncbi:hypothetical protein niasHS_012237 [Heterodera schachtii]|uniref:Uncharacterized protein n=1 Tax=Heterodera schachtii TaxID=97005 RepID=A0ABD2IJ57_HETSC
MDPFDDPPNFGQGVGFDPLESAGSDGKPNQTEHNANQMQHNAKQRRQSPSFSFFLEQQRKIIEHCTKSNNSKGNGAGESRINLDGNVTSSSLPPHRPPFTESSFSAASDRWHCPWGAPPPPPRPAKILSTYEEIDAFAEMRRKAEECDLIDLSDPPPDKNGNGDDEGNDKNNDGDETCSTDDDLEWSNGGDQWESLSAGWTVHPMAPSATVPSTFRADKLPRQAIIYDYTTQPIGVVEHKRTFLPPAHSDGRALLSYPFLRPIFLDGVGLIKAYRACCTENNELPDRSHPYELHFPLMPIVRCLFYWISRGHRTVLCFSQQFSPMGDEIFQATDEDKRNLKTIEENGMADFFKHTNSKEWFDRRSGQMHGCFVTTVPHYLKGMPHDLRYFLSDNDHRPWDHCAERLLQPFYDHKGNTVFFSLYNSKNQCVDSVVLMDEVNSRDQFEEVERHQLSFMEQVLQLKVLFNLLPKDARFRERNLMVEVFTRLKPFL